MANFLSLPESIQADILVAVAERADVARKAEFLLLSRRYLPYLRRILYRNLSFRIGPEAYRAQKFVRTLEADPSLGSFVESLELVEAHLGATSYGMPGTQIGQNIFKYIAPKVLRFEMYTIPIWLFTALRSHRLEELEMDFNSDRWSWTPPEDTHLLNADLDKGGVPWFLKEPLNIKRLRILRPPGFPKFGILLDLALRMSGYNLQDLTVQGTSINPSVHETMPGRLDHLQSLTCALTTLERQIPIDAFSLLRVLTLTSIEASQVELLPAFILNPGWLPKLRYLRIYYQKDLMVRFLQGEIDAIYEACKSRGLSYERLSTSPFDG